MLEKVFKLKEKNTNVKTEIIAGITTFLAMAYILGVNPLILGDAGMDTPSVFMATAISAGFASIVMGVIANYPVSLAAGMGVNALFAYTICGTMGFSWQAALAGVFVSGLIFIVISVTGIRKAIINAIPIQLKLAIGAGIGFFIAFVGLKNAGIIVANPSTFVGLGNLADPTVLLAVFGILVTIALLALKVPAGVFVGMVITAVIGIICGSFFGMEGMPVLPESIFETSFQMNGLGAFMDGFGELFANPLTTFVVIFSFLFVDFFDTAGTLVAVANRIGLVNEKGELENAEQALLADAIGTVAGAALGTSTVTSFVESTSGVEVGGKTGLTACTTGVMFFISILFAPIILSAVTNAVTAPALVVVGILMAQQLKGIDWEDFVYGTAGFVTIIAMILTYSISNGIAFGFIAYTVAMIASGKAKEIHVTVWVLIVIFVIYFALPQLM
ncbi:MULTISPECIES: NCS2 family permease [Bacillota]|jgi:AGZA family xanthine/uracil permease-like MFS transporter|uniref:NCS2 family permease n=2 Tax=Amedibacillus TaxID=2749846 RepID=A0A7G9GN98_9FIRM|nr:MULTISPECIES: NCS2 family permease [Bacillota]QNM12280.1 NCS2 family permease [[Eubacterium] hominis]MCH4284371.1 NCS2 family permease [Amedibacillus hominis]RGB57384.1 NCS2 family permease [Absiella sp. AM22-9]RGB59661.1 NCS2 family permease [Absiella sp. AM10-20]RGB66364.1 NCS2 family permease [Absiella sp. AM09-45]